MLLGLLASSGPDGWCKRPASLSAPAWWADLLALMGICNTLWEGQLADTSIVPLPPSGWVLDELPQLGNSKEEPLPCLGKLPEAEAQRSFQECLSTII